MRKTTLILRSFRCWTTGFSILGGALKIGSSLLNFQPSRKELNELTNSFLSPSNQGSIISPSQRKLLSDLTKRLDYIPLNRSEVHESSINMKELAQSQFTKMLQDIKNSNRDECTNILLLAKELTKAVDENEEECEDDNIYRVNNSISIVHKKFQALLKAKDNLTETFNSVNFLCFQFEAKMSVKKSLRPENISEYLKRFKSNYLEHQKDCRDIDINHTAELVFICLLLINVELLYLCIVHHIFNKDSTPSKTVEKVAYEFQSFNEHYSNLLQIYKTIFGSIFNIDEDPFIRLINLKDRYEQAKQGYATGSLQRKLRHSKSKKAKKRLLKSQ